MQFSSSTLVIRYLPMFVIPNFARRFLGIPIHPLFPKLNHTYKTTDKQLLLWHVSGFKMSDFKHAPRLWCTRRTRAAFLNALRERGFDEKGRRIRPSAASTATATRTGTVNAANRNVPGPKQERDLRGTLTITMNRECMSQDFATVQSDINRLLDTLLERLRTRPWEVDRLKTEGAAKKQIQQARRRIGRKTVVG